MAKRRKPILRFFHTKPMETPNETLDLNEIAETPVEEQVEVVTPMDSPEEQPAPAESDAPVSEDRSAFNCSRCGGEGLVNTSDICPDCNGTGKV